MAAVTLTPTDLEPFATIDEAKALTMIEDAMALAARVAPCIESADFAYEAAARAILRGAILRWHESGTGALQTRTVGAVSEGYDTRQQRRGMFWPSEIHQLQDLCRDADLNKSAFSIDTINTSLVHSETCAINFGANYCDCGAILTGSYPLFDPPAPTP